MAQQHADSLQNTSRCISEYGSSLKIESAEFLSVKDVSVLLGVSEKTVRGWVYKKLLIPERVGPRLIRFRKKDIESWISKFKGDANGD